MCVGNFKAVSDLGQQTVRGERNLFEKQKENRNYLRDEPSCRS